MSYTSSTQKYLKIQPTNFTHKKKHSNSQSNVNNFFQKMAFLSVSNLQSEITLNPKEVQKLSLYSLISKINYFKFYRILLIH